MLRELFVKNIVLIESLNVHFKNGLSVLTGETGAGKSILLDCIGLILGNRVDFNLIRNNENVASVTAIFEIYDKHPVVNVLEKFSVNHETELIIRREININGKSKCIINDVVITRNALIEITDNLIEVQGQFEDRGLLNTKTHLSLLDAFADHNDLIENSREAYNSMINILKLINEAEAIAKKNNEDNDWLKDSYDQLVLLDPKFKEEEELDKNKKYLANRTKINTAMAYIRNIIEKETGLEDLINQVIKSLESMYKIENENINSAIEIINGTKADIEELKNIVNGESLETTQGIDRLELIEDRLHALRTEARKHNCTVDDLITIRNKLKNSLNDIKDNNFKIEDLKKEYDDAKMKFVKLSTLLSESRKKYATILTEKINDELPQLKLENARLSINFDKVSIDDASILGIDKVTFLASTNSNNNMLPINKIASGGELSRFLLAIKVVLEAAIHNRTIIFDEIDSGIGGSVANAVGTRLAKLGASYQAMVVTHSPQVTSKGHNHYLVQKNMNNNQTYTNILELTENEKIEEIARMLSGSNITNEAREAAFKLLDNK
ncbi:DNA repair protein RecN [Candidatus Levibacter sp. Uisw_134_01]|uniref:DNA repair protein RecN n=1 Tax=Candidatus Levibacter sp. Uisw_134_01 TaxID=3230999 RepID=UPI003D4733F6